MSELHYSQYRDYRGYVIEAATNWLGRPRYIVWLNQRRLGKFGAAMDAERFIDGEVRSFGGEMAPE